MTKNIKKVLVSGYDLKFWNALQKELEATGLFEFRQDTLIGNYGHNDAKALELIEWADILIAEWTLNNAVFLSEHKKPHQKLITRFHLQERLTEFPAKINYSKVDAVLFVGPHIMYECIDKFNIPQSICKVVGNFIDMEKFSLPKFGDAAFNIGIIGTVPARKRLDLAFDTLEELVKIDSRYRLHVKGQSPDSYPWLWKRPEEKKYYEELYQRINTSDLRNCIVFDPPGSDVNFWLQKIGYILSPSDFESFHVAIPEGVSSSAIPIVWNWEGASEIYPPFQLVNNPIQAAKLIDILRRSNTKDQYLEHSKNLIQSRYSKNIIMHEWKEILLHGIDKKENTGLSKYKKILLVYAISEYKSFHRKEMLDALAKKVQDDCYILIVEPGTHYSTVLNSGLDDEISLNKFAKAEIISLNSNIGRIKALYGNVPHVVEADSEIRKIKNQKDSIRYFLTKNFGIDVEITHWLYKPDQIKFINDNEQYFYEVYDEYTMDFATGKINQEIFKLEQDILRNAKHVFFTSNPLYERKKIYTTNASVISNGVVFDLFNKYKLDQTPNIGLRKSVGYLGNLSDFFNWDLVYGLCIARPDLDFFFHGQLELKNDSDKDSFEKINKLPNTYFSSRVTREQGAAAVNRYDVLIIPFVINDAMHAVNPLKLWEYFATGIPVISSPMDAVKIPEPILYVARSSDDWLNKLNIALDETSDSDICVQRIEMAKEVSWEHLAEKYSNVIKARN